MLQVVKDAQYYTDIDQLINSLEMLIIKYQLVDIH